MDAVASATDRTGQELAARCVGGAVLRIGVTPGVEHIIMGDSFSVRPEGSEQECPALGLWLSQN